MQEADLNAHFLSRIFPLLLFIKVLAHANEPLLEKEFFETLDPYFISIKCTQGQSIATQEGYTSLQTFAFPCNYKSVYPFFDLRFHCLNESDAYAANAGLGVRFAKEELIFGINAYYDCRKKQGNIYNQTGIGVEFFWKCWNFRMNGYLPVGKKKHLFSQCFYDGYQGKHFYLVEKFQSSLKGIDFQLEASIYKCQHLEILLGIGGYNYHGYCEHKSIYGSSYRIRGNFWSLVVLDVLGSYDCFFKARVQAQLSIVIPLPFCPKEIIQLFQPVLRQEIIVIEKYKLYSWDW